MNKPISIMMNELRSSLVGAVNESGLPVIISAQILGEIQQLCLNKSREEESNYYQALKESEEKANELQ